MTDSSRAAWLAMNPDSEPDWDNDQAWHVGPPGDRLYKHGVCIHCGVTLMGDGKKLRRECAVCLQSAYRKSAQHKKLARLKRLDKATSP